MELVILLVMLILPIWASINVKTTFNKYKKVKNSRGITADEVARQILDSHGLFYIRIERIRGDLTDHYDPTENVVRLSDSVYGKTSVAAIGVAAHECGHAVQHAEEYGPIKTRATLVPIANICSRFWYLAFVIGLIFFETFPQFIYVGIVMFAAVVLFQLVTLPVEFDASDRALNTLEAQGILEYSELPHARKVLRAAAFTYVAALVTSILQLIRLLAIANRRSK